MVAIVVRPQAWSTGLGGALEIAQTAVLEAKVPRSQLIAYRESFRDRRAAIMDTQVRMADPLPGRVRWFVPKVVVAPGRKRAEARVCGQLGEATVGPVKAVARHRPRLVHPRM